MQARFRTIYCFSLAMLTLALTSGTTDAQVAKLLFRSNVKVLAGAGGATSMKLATDMKNNHQAATYRQEKVKKNVADELKRQGASEDENTVCSLYLNLDRNNSTLYWADTLSWPDIYFVVEIEGQGFHLLPRIHYGYKGGVILDKILTKSLKPGNRIVIRVLDDDSTSEAIWKSLLSTQINFHLDGVGAFSRSHRVEFGVNGSVQLLQSGSQVVIKSPDHVAVAEFRVPETTENTWMADVEFIDPKGSKAGLMQFAKVWSAEPFLAEANSALESLEKDKRGYASWLVFFAIIGVLLLLVWAKSMGFFDVSKGSIGTEGTTNLSDDNTPPIK